MPKITVKIDLTVEIEAADEKAAKDGAISRAWSALDRAGFAYVDLVFVESYDASAS